MTTQILSNEEFQNPENQNRDKAIIGYRDVPDKKDNYLEYKQERTRRETEIKELWKKERAMVKMIIELEDKLHKDFPETKGEDPGY